MSPHALEASGPGQAATREEVRDSGCRVCNNFPCLCRKSLIGSGLTRRITYKKVSMVDQRKFEGASKVSQEKLPGGGWEFNTVLTSAGGCHLDRRKTTSKSREGGRVPAHVCMGPQELVPFTAPPPEPPSRRHVSGTYFPVPAYLFLGSSFSANPCGSSTSFCCWRGLSLSTSCTP